MKQRLLGAALACCLCAPAAPLPRIFTADPITNESAPIAPDLSLNSIAIDDSFAAEEPSGLIATGIDVPDSIVEEGFTIDDRQGSGSLRAPEPPPVAMVAAGLGILAVFGILRRLCAEKRRARRRTLVRIRALTAIQ